jgi:hypothetical protein
LSYALVKLITRGIGHMRRIPFSELSSADLIVDAIYEGEKGTSSYGGEPLHHLLPGLGTQGGFRKRKGLGEDLVGLILTSTGNEPDWPDELNPFTGTYTYYGDNRTPGKDLHDTKAGGNKTLAKIFELAHLGIEERSRCPIVLIFEATGTGRDMVFRGLAVPGSNQQGPREDLVATWKTYQGERFQNYRATFSILDCGVISGIWLRKAFSERVVDFQDPGAPDALKTWVEAGKIMPLLAEPVKTRSSELQLPLPGLQTAIVNKIRDFCKEDPFLFEPLAADLWRMSCPAPLEMEMTKRYRDGGRDAIGHMLLGPVSDAIKVSFALEAKLYALGNKVGVRETSRLISRLRHREFGVLVTTSALDKQAYEEVRSDQHPIIVISGRDIAETLIQQGINSTEMVESWISRVME